MTLNELASRIAASSRDSVAQDASALLLAWCDDDTTVTDLRTTIDRYFGHTWMSDVVEYNTIYSLWSKFRESAIDRIDGMTMNERLHRFSLTEVFAAADTEEGRLRIYIKLKAHP